MSIFRRLLPKSVRFRAPRFLNHLSEAQRFYRQQFHQEKSARELRQRRSDYRCCIPALAGFVSLQSIAPDGGKTFAQDHHRATATRETDNDIVTSLRIDSTSCIWLHRRHEMARSLHVGRCGMLLHYHRQPARSLQPAAGARSRLAPANHDHDNNTHGRGCVGTG